MRDRNWRTGEGFTNGLTQQDIDYLASEFRACEQQMLDDDVPAAAYHGEKGYTMGYIAALDAAEKAILELHYPLQNVTTLQWCSECSGFDGDEIEWPCRTVEQIRSLKDLV